MVQWLRVISSLSAKQMQPKSGPLSVDIPRVWRSRDYCGVEVLPNKESKEFLQGGPDRHRRECWMTILAYCTSLYGPRAGDDTSGCCLTRSVPCTCPVRECVLWLGIRPAFPVPLLYRI